MKNDADKMDSPQFVYKYLEKNPDAVFFDYKADFPSTMLNSAVFGQRKYFLRKRKSKRVTSPKSNLISSAKKNDETSPEFIYEYIQEDKSRTYTAFKNDFPDTKVTEPMFSSRKHYFLSKQKKEGTKQKGRINAIEDLKYENTNAFVKAYLSIDPTKTFSDLNMDFKNVDMCEGTYYSRKHHFIKRGENKKNGVIRQYAKRKNNKLYMTIWEESLEGKTEKEKILIKNIVANLINTISESGRINWQIVELSNPSMLELREVAK